MAMLLMVFFLVLLMLIEAGEWQEKPAAIIALLQFGPGHALVAITGLVVIQQLLGNVVDPRMSGRSLEISPIVVLVSIVFWGWVWGLVGTLIGVLLTATLVIVFEHIPALRPVAVLLSRRASDVSPPG